MVDICAATDSWFVVRLYGREDPLVGLVFSLPKKTKQKHKTGQTFFQPVGRHFFIPWADIFSARGQTFFQPMGRYFSIPWADIFPAHGQIFFHPMGRHFFSPWADIFSSQRENNFLSVLPKVDHKSGS